MQDYDHMHIWIVKLIRMGVNKAERSPRKSYPGLSGQVFGIWEKLNWELNSDQLNPFVFASWKLRHMLGELSPLKNWVLYLNCGESQMDVKAQTFRTEDIHWKQTQTIKRLTIESSIQDHKNINVYITIIFERF